MWSVQAFVYSILCDCQPARQQFGINIQFTDLTRRVLRPGTDIYNVNLDLPSISSDSEFSKYLKKQEANQANLQPPRYAQDPLLRQLSQAGERENLRLVPPGEKQDPLLRQLNTEETFRVINLR